MTTETNYSELYDRVMKHPWTCSVEELEKALERFILNQPAKDRLYQYLLRRKMLKHAGIKDK